MAATTSRSHYRIEILCPSSKSELRLERGSAQERLGALFEINLSLYSEDRAIDMLELLGQPLAVHLTSDNDERYFHGIISHFALVGFSERYAHYQVVLRPKLWLLGQSAMCKVFRSMTVSDILQKTFQAGSVDFGDVKCPQVQFEHCVQYRETDLCFVSRLMERYGAYYFHSHEKDKHKLQVVSDQSGHSDIGTFTHTDAGSVADEYQISEWRLTASLRSSSYRVAGTKNLTRQPIEAKQKSRFSIDAAPPLKIDEFEAVDEYAEPHLEALAKARMQAIDATVEEFSGRSSSLKLEVGGLFTLEGHRRADQNRKYLVVAATYQFEGDLPDGGPGAEDPYHVFFQAIDSKTPFSPPVLTRKPVVQGPHLATVTEETDEYGRVLVQFHWGNPDGDIESCRARVSQNWAGKEWGGVFLPHKGHEVIVEFLDGDPDQPLVTGRVYNKESMPPLSLPGDKQKSIIRDHGGNEIMMDGTEDAQKIHIYCPKHESEIWLGKSVEIKSASNWVNDFLGFKKEDVKKDSTSNVGGNSSSTVTGNNESKVGGNSKEAVSGDKEESFVGKCSIKTGADMLEFFVGTKHGSTIGATVSTFHGMSLDITNAIKIGRGKSKEILKYKDIYQKAGITKIDAEDYWLVAKGKIDFEAADMQQVADNTMKLKGKEGTVEFETGTWKGKEHSHQPSSRFEVKTGEVFIEAGSNIVLEGKRIGLCGSVFEVKA